MVSAYNALSAWGEKLARPKPNKQKIHDDRPLTWAGFNNGLHAFEGIIATLTNLQSDLIFNKLGQCISDYYTSLEGMFESQVEKVMRYIAQRSNMLTGEVRHNNTMLADIFAYLTSNQRQESNRYLATQEAIRLTAEANTQRTDAVMNTAIDMFDNISEQIQALRKERADQTAPSLYWLMQNFDELARFTRAMTNLRENNLPYNNAVAEVVKALQVLTKHETSIAEIGSVVGTEVHVLQLAA